MAVVLSVTGGYPIQTFQARVSFDRMIRIDSWLLPDRTDNDGVCFDLFSRDTARKMLSSTLLVWTSVGIAFFVSDLDAVIDLTGAVGGGATAFILPCVAYVYCAPQDARTLRWVWVVLGTALVSLRPLLSLSHSLPLCFSDSICILQTHTHAHTKRTHILYSCTTHCCSALCGVGKGPQCNGCNVLAVCR